MAVGPFEIVRLVVRFQNGQFVAAATECLQQAAGLLRLADRPRLPTPCLRMPLLSSAPLPFPSRGPLQL